MGSRGKHVCLLILAVIPYLYITARLFLVLPAVWPDEAILTDVAKTFISTGHIATHIYGGAIHNIDVRYYLHPPGYIMMLASWIRMFGPGIESVRLLSSFVGVASLILFWMYVFRLYRSGIRATAGTVLLSMDSYFGLASRTARMEIVVFFLLIATLLAVQIAGKRTSALWFLMAGILASCALMTHPLGIIVWILAVVAVVVQRKKINRHVMAVVMPPVLAAAGWFISMGKYFPVFIAQYRLNFIYRTDAVPHLFTLPGQGRVWQMYLVCTGLIICLHIIKIIRRRTDVDVLVLCGFFISLVFIIWGKVFWYTIYLQPYIALVILGLFAHPPTKNVMRYAVFFVCFCLITAQAAILSVTLQSAKGMQYGYHQFARMIQSQVSRGGRVLLVSIPDPYFDLQNDPGLTLYELGVKLPDRDIKTLMDNVDTVVYTNISNPYVVSYINSYKKSTTQIVYGYPVTVVSLLPRAQRYGQ